MGWRTWRAAMDAALYGPGGFYSGGARPAAHFRTSVHASPRFAEAVLRLARTAGLDTVVDMGAGEGELLRHLAALDPALVLYGVDVRPAPAGLPARWLTEPPELDSALVIANEWLDNVPLDVVATTPDGPRVVLVDETGAQRTGPEPDPADADWLRRWWPEVRAGADVGRTRDAAWADVVARLRGGLAVAVDYAHTRDHRPADATLTGYRAGRAVPPVPDGSCDLTADVALDACAAAGEAAGATDTVLTDQRTALRALGVTGARPPWEQARRDPTGYLRGLERAGQGAELTDRSGLGAFGWLVQSVRTAVPILASSAGGRHADEARIGEDGA